MIVFEKWLRLTCIKTWESDNYWCVSLTETGWRCVAHIFSLLVPMGSVLALSSRPGRQNSPFPLDRPLARWDRRDGRLPNPGSFDGLHRSCKGKVQLCTGICHLLAAVSLRLTHIDSNREFWQYWLLFLTFFFFTSRCISTANWRC